MAANRELIDTGTDKRYVRRDEKGRFKESDDVGRSLAADRRQTAPRPRPRRARATAATASRTDACSGRPYSRGLGKAGRAAKSSGTCSRTMRAFVSAARASILS